jgi:hypothetical protein
MMYFCFSAVAETTSRLVGADPRPTGITDEIHAMLQRRALHYLQVCNDLIDSCIHMHGSPHSGPRLVVPVADSLIRAREEFVVDQIPSVIRPIIRSAAAQMPGSDNQWITARMDSLPVAGSWPFDNCFVPEFSVAWDDITPLGPLPTRARLGKLLDFRIRVRCFQFTNSLFHRYTFATACNA